MTPTTIPNVFPVPSSITKSEPTPEARDPAIFCLTNSGTASGTRNFFACRKALAGCRGAALTWWSLYYRPCGGNTNMYLVPIFSPERWQSVGSSAPLSPPQERTVSRRRRETTKCASALNARMNSGSRTANHFAVFVQELRHTIDKLAHRKPTKCALIQTSLRFVCRAICDTQKTEKRREFSGQDV